MSAMADTKITCLDETIAAYERAVFSPAVPGELVTWTAEAQKSLKQLQEAVVENAELRHSPIYDMISDTDPEMLGKVQQLEAEDDALLQRIGETIEIAKTLYSVATAVDRDEAKANNLKDGFIKAAEAVSIRLKKQELAIDVWMQESQTRDRGVKD
jgi:hypothetical protein